MENDNDSRGNLPSIPFESAESIDDIENHIHAVAEYLIRESEDRENIDREDIDEAWGRISRSIDELERSVNESLVDGLFTTGVIKGEYVITEQNTDDPALTTLYSDFLILVYDYGQHLKEEINND